MATKENPGDALAAKQAEAAPVKAAPDKEYKAAIRFNRDAIKGVTWPANASPMITAGTKVTLPANIGDDYARQGYLTMVRV
jgi:hypothetical protein